MSWYRDPSRTGMHRREESMRGADMVMLDWRRATWSGRPPDQKMSTYDGNFEQGKISHRFYPEPIEWVRDDRGCHSRAERGIFA